MSCHADHKWALADEAQAEATFEKLARCLVMADTFNTESPSDIYVRRADKGSNESGLKASVSRTSTRTHVRRSARLLVKGHGQHLPSKPMGARSSTCSTTPSSSGSDKNSESDASRCEKSGSWTKGSTSSDSQVVTTVRDASGAGGCDVCARCNFSENGVTSLGNFREGGRALPRESFRERRFRETAGGRGGRTIRNARDVSRERDAFSRRSGSRCVRLRWSVILLLVLCVAMVVGIFAVVDVGQRKK